MKWFWNLILDLCLLHTTHHSLYIWKRFNTKSIYVYYMYGHEGKQRHRQGAGTVNCI